MTRTEIDDWLKERNITPDCKLSSGIPKFIKKNMMEDFKRETGSNSDNPTELLYLYLHPGINTKCPVCGNDLPFQNFFNGYRKACCQKCSSILTVQKGKQTLLEKYGVENAMQVQEFKDKCFEDVDYNARHQKAVETNLKKYGVDNPMKVEEFKNKLRDTSIEKYGVDNPSQSNEVHQKMINTNLERYGTEYVGQNPEIKEKMLNTKKVKKEERLKNLRKEAGLDE